MVGLALFGSFTALAVVDSATGDVGDVAAVLDEVDEGIVAISMTI